MTGTVAASAQNPVANFTANVTSGCAPLTVTFTDQSTGNPTSWNWEFSNGTLSSAQNPVVTFTNPGIYSVKLVVQNASGIDQIEKIDYITVFPSLIADFGSDINLSCLPAVINFQDLSIAPPGSSIVSWLWNFGDGTTSTLQNPTHAYSSTGFFGVSLTVTSNNGCKQIAFRGSFIRVVAGVSTNFAYSVSGNCQAPITVDFSNQSSGPGAISYTWDFGNGQTSTVPNPSTVYNAAGTYTVTLNAQSDLGCGGSIQKTVTITSTTTDFTAPVFICLNQPANFQNSSSAPPVSSSWNFGDGTISGQINPIKTFITPGTFDVTLINHYSNCTDSITKTVVVNDKPQVDFTANDSLSCRAPFTVQFTDVTIGGTSWLWDFGDGNTSTQQNPSHDYMTMGNYNVSLTVTTAAGCTNTIVKPTFVRIQPVSVSLNLPAGGCIPFTYTPQATIQTLDPVVSYTWDLGEPGAIFNVANPPPYTYTAAGSYDVTLTVVTATGCTKTVTVSNGIRTGIRPIVDFSVNPVDDCASADFAFTDLSVTTPGAFVSWLWDFGDGGSSTMQNPHYSFSDTGSISVTLIVSNNGCTDSAKHSVHVKPPVAIFGYTVDCLTRQVTVSDTSIVDTGIPFSYLWSMGDPANTQFNVPNPPPFSYPSPGTYNITLTVTNGGCVFPTTHPVTIANEPADFSISRNPVCKNETFTLTAINSNAANIKSYSWTIGAITLPGTGRSVNYSIATNGTYSVTLTITDINDCVTTKTINNYITVRGPTALFVASAPGACLNKPIAFTDQSTPIGGITNWSFDFGDGAQQNFSAPPFTHSYSTLGGYPVSLTVRDASGCTDTYSSTANLLVTRPIVGFLADTFYCPGSPLQFVDTSSGAGLSYAWSFGDGNTSTLSNPTNSYPLGDADYTVSLKIRDLSGCEDSVTKPAYIKIRSPKALFDIQNTVSICPPLLTSFTFLGTNYQTFYWDFGDGSTSNLTSTFHFYDYGHYIPTLYAIGPGGCVDSAKSVVDVYNPFAAIQINYGPTTSACNSLTVDFNLVLPPGFKFYFYFGDGKVDSSGATTFSHFYSRPSFNQPAVLIVDTVSGCQALVYGVPRIDVLGAVPLFSIDKDKFCDNGPVVFTDFTTKNEPIISTVWDFDDGTTSNVQSPTHNFTQPGTYLVTLSVTTQSNCTSSYTDTVFVYRTPVPSIAGKDTICLSVTADYNGSVAVPDSLTTWQWNFGNGTTSSNQNNSITYNSTGNFTIQLITTNQVGCGDTTSKTIYVSPPPTATPVKNPITIISGASTDLAMTYTGNIDKYTWSPGTRLNCNNCPIPLANPQSTTTYTVSVEDANGCKNSSDITVIVVCNNLNFFIPNTFTPNGDGVNDVFYPRGTGLFRVKSMTIFNRWGEIVYDKKDFAPNDPAAGWTGIFRGQRASPDVYVYMVDILCDNNVTIPVKGNVTLIR